MGKRLSKYKRKFSPGLFQGFFIILLFIFGCSSSGPDPDPNPKYPDNTLVCGEEVKYDKTPEDFQEAKDYVEFWRRNKAIFYDNK